MGGNTGSICGDANNNFLRFKGRNLSTESNMTVGGTLTANGGITVPYGYSGRLLEMSNASGISGMTITDGGGLRAAYPGGIDLGATSGGATFKSALKIAATTNAITVPGNLTVGGAFNNRGLTSTLATLNGRMTALSNVMRSTGVTTTTAMTAMTVMASSNARTTMALKGELATLSARLLSLSNAIVGELIQRPIAVVKA
jgi:hypothetical protein